MSPIPPSGPISLTDLASEFNDNTPLSLGDYYRGGPLVPDAAPNANIPNSPGVEISLSDFYGAVNAIVVTLTTAGSPYENLDIKSYVDAQDPTLWNSGLPIQIIIETGVIIGATSNGNPALSIPSRSGSTTIQNDGSIRGAGGTSSNGGTGGNALLTNTPISVTNNGQIYGGGGQGGNGGTGGQGRTSSSYPPSCTPTGQGACCGGCPGGQSPTGQNCFCRPGCCVPTCCQNFPGGTNYYPQAGGAGGAGGRGRGYDGADAPGALGSPGGTYAGVGGEGGPGGTWGTVGGDGQPGTNGNIGSGLAGETGKAAGTYIIGNSLVTWDALGLVAGGVAS